LACALAPLATAEPVRTDNVEVELVSARASAAPGETFDIALRQRIRPGWHTYWINPGDSGEPTELRWTATGGASPGELRWPAPERIPFDILVNYGYSGEILFPITLTAPADARPGDVVPLRAHATWLVCSDICIPEEADLALNLAIAGQGQPDAVWARPIAAAVAALPQPAPFQAAITGGEAGATLSVAGRALAGGAARNVHFFPYDRDAALNAAPENPRFGPSGIALALEPGPSRKLGSEPLVGVLTFEARNGGGWVRQAFELTAAPGPVLPGVADTAAGGLAQTGGGALTAPLALLFAFLGGLILNVMPCVFPALSLKALTLAQDPAGARQTGLYFLAGVMTTFLGLAGMLIALKAGGEAIGWGFQLQSPIVVASLATLFFLIGLNLAGVFEIGGALQNLGGGLAARAGHAGAFFTGALAVIAATPCTAPFMASATGFAATQGPVTTLAVFAALGLGFALPMAALAWVPALRALLPKPGAWMNRMKVVLAFPMFGAAVWLAWVLTAQTGPNGLLALLSVATALAFVIVVGAWGRTWRIATLAALLAVGWAAWRPLSTPAEAATVATEAEAWSPARVAALVDEGRGVFVDFTATWCVTCQLNKATTLRSRDVQAAFAREDVVLLEADWTNRDDTIARALAEHGRDGVPLYLYYAPGEASPRVLPQILSVRIVLDAIADGRS
jgi:thiol:disulfide interchange protein DsbD